MAVSSIETGKKGQKLAAEFLASAGYTIVAQNYRFGMLGEIDIVARKDALCLFVEVKLRTNPLYDATSAVGPAKIRHLKRAATGFLVKNPDVLAEICRFDLICVVNGELMWHKDIFR